MILFCNSSLKEDNKLTYEEINDTDEDINDTDKYKNQKEQFNNKKDYHSLDQISIKKVILFLILGALTLYGVYLIYIYFSTRKIVKKVGEINDLRTDMINLIISIDDCIDIINSQNENYENIIKLQKIKKELDELCTQLDASKLLKDKDKGDIKFNSVKSLFKKNKEEFQQIKKELELDENQDLKKED